MEQGAIRNMCSCRKCAETEIYFLTKRLGITFASDKDDKGASSDKIVRVCYTLVNLCPSVVHMSRLDDIVRK